MQPIKITLAQGFKQGEVVHKDAELRAPTAGDLIDAGAESEVMKLTQQGFQLVQSPTLVSAHVLRRQIVCIGGYKGPLTLQELGSLSGEDYSALQAAASKLDQAAAEALQARGRADAPGGTGG